MLKLGYCRECTASYPSPVVTDGLCPDCQKYQDTYYANDPTPVFEEPPVPYTKAWMRERLGVSGDVDE